MSEGQWKDLAICAQKGDSSAYRQLLSDILPVLKQFISRKVGVMAQVDDLVQETLIAINGSLSTYRPENSFKSWMFAIARYKIIDYFREHGRKFGKNVQFDEDFVTNESDHTTLINEERDRSAREELMTAMSKALSLLSAEQREAVELTKLHGLSTVAAAEKQGITPQALRTRISRAYNTMRKSIEKEMGGDTSHKMAEKTAK